jgi:hypothetical protein
MFVTTPVPGALYAPNGTVRISAANFNVQGSLVGDQVEIQSSTTFSLKYNAAFAAGTYPLPLVAQVLAPTTSPLPPLSSPPTLSSPTAGRTVLPNRSGTIGLSWATDTLAIGTQVQVANDPAFTTGSIVMDFARLDTFHAAVLQPGAYYWRGRTINGAGASGWSSTENFVVSGAASTPTPTSTRTVIPTSTPTPTVGSTSSQEWETFTAGLVGWSAIGNVSAVQQSGNGFMRLSPPGNASAEASRSAAGVTLLPYQAIELDVNVNGATLLDGDASALFLDQGGWKFISLSRYVVQGSTGWRTVRVPLRDFVGFNPAASFARLGVRVWVPSAAAIDIDNVRFVP